jgi:hypothetical protein
MARPSVISNSDLYQIHETISQSADNTMLTSLMIANKKLKEDLRVQQ